MASPSIKPCPHLGEAIEGDVLTVETLCGCNGQKKNTEKTFQVHECEEKGRCVPKYQCTKEALSEEIIDGEWADACKLCELNPANQ